MRPLHIPPVEINTKRVVKPAGSGDWPWVAALLKDGVHSCDATLVHPSWLITTSLCFQGQGRALWVARLGTTRISSKAPWVQERLIVGMVKSDVATSKIVLIKLEKNLEMSDYVRPACLGSHRDATYLAKRRCRTLGWGARQEMNGAGIVCEWADRWEVVGIATGRSGCSSGARPRMYDNITPETVNWIKKTISAFERRS
ncbi:Plasma kallikrein [Armadillidium vulgare]|nr:Plasma kallikrein [Armadillidium vulgare]